MTYCLSIFVLTFSILFFIPMLAMAKCWEVNVQPVQRCGPRCILASKVCSSSEEANEFAIAWQGTIRQVSETRWMVDYQITEVEFKTEMENEK